MRPTIDNDECIGCGQCEQFCPAVFELRDDGLAYVIDENPSEGLSQEIDEAMEECPTAAISWEEERHRRIL